MNPLELLFGALAGIFVGNRVARNNMDPAQYTATRIRYRTTFSKWAFALLGIACIWIGGAVASTGGGGAGVIILLLGVGSFVWGWRVAPARIVRQESARHAREQQTSDSEAARRARGEFRPDDPEYWRSR